MYTPSLENFDKIEYDYTMKHKISKKLLFAIIAVCILIIGVGTTFLVNYLINRNILTVSFYDLDDKTRLAIEQTIADTTTASNSNVTFEFIMLDTSLTLEEQVEETDIVFTLAGKNAESIVKHSVGVPLEQYDNFPKSIGSTGFFQNTPYAVPIALNHFEISYNAYLLRNYNGGTPLRTFDQLIPFAEYVQRSAPQTGFPFAIAGGDNTTLLLFLSAMVESYYGKDAYTQLVEILRSHPIKSKEDFLNLVQQPLRSTENNLEASTLENLFKTVQTWKQWRLIHPEWMFLTEKNILDFIDLERPAVLFMPLSYHRSIPFDDIRYYTTSWFPAGQSSVSRSLIVPTVLGIPLSDKTVKGANNTEKMVNALSILANLASNSTQGTLNDTTEFAPVHSTAQALDKQASDLRLWAAASDSLLPSIKESAFVTSAEVSVFCELFRTWLKDSY